MLTAFFLASMVQLGSALPPATPSTFLPADRAPDLKCVIEPIETITINSFDGAVWDAPRVRFDDAILAELESIAAGEQAVLTQFPMPVGASGALPTVDLVLKRISIAASHDDLLLVDGVPSLQSVTSGVALFTGRVLGNSDSDVYLAASDQGTRGWVRFGSAHAPRVVHLIAEPNALGDWSASTTLIVDDMALGFAPQTMCAVEDLPNGGRMLPPEGLPATPNNTKPGSQQAISQVMRELSIAVETDFNLFQGFGTLKATKAYVVSVMGAVSARYREQLNVVITLPYVGIYTNANDPWITPDLGLGSIDLLYEFQNSWYANMPVQASLGHFISGANLGGGVAWLDALCLPEIQFGVSGNIGGNLPFPVTQGPINWDFIVIAHEIGHNIATPHTHDFCPPIDQCASAQYFGQCQNSQVCLTNGTLMSYCHTCSGGVQNITTYFHPQVVQVLDARIANSCLPPYEGLLTTNLGGGVIGAAGVPTISPTYDRDTDALGMTYGMAPVQALGAVIVSGAKLGAPLFGGILWPNPDLILYFNTMSASGTIAEYSFQGFTYPDGLDLIVQSWFIDPQAPAGYSGTDGWKVEVVIPIPPPTLTWFPHPTNGKEYAVTAAGTWPKGRQLAREYGGELASLDNAALETWLRQTFFNSGVVNGTVFIGLTDQTSEGTFKWINGVPATYTNWAPNEPNDWNGFEDYGSWGGGKWNDLSGYDVLPALIER